MRSRRGRRRSPWRPRRRRRTPARCARARGSPSTSPSLRSGTITRLIPARCAASDFSFRPPIGSTWPVRVTSPVIATSLRTGRPLISEASATVIATPAEGPSLGTAPAGTWMWMSCSANQSSSSSGAISLPVAAHVGERRLRRLLHHVAELAGDRQPARARHRGRLDEEDVAAGRRPGEAGRDAGVLGAAALLGEDAAAAEQLAGASWPRSLTLPLTLPSATSRATLRQTVPIWRSRLRTPASRVYSSMIAVSAGVGELDLRGLQAVGLDLARRPGSGGRCASSPRACSRRVRSSPSGPAAGRGSCRGRWRWR